MKISALRLSNVKRFAGRGVAIEGIGDGVNVLCAANEFGKSTSFEALHALFFQPHTGTPADVQRLRPYSGGNPLIEVDIATEQGHFRITKQYYGGRSARVIDLATDRLLAQADEAENFIARLIKGGPAGPAGLLWVRQGLTGLEKRPRSEEESEKLVRASLLESVQGEVEAITGGRRMAEIIAATTEALSSLLTPTGKPKTGGRYAAIIAERENLAEQEERLRNEVDQLRDALSKRELATKRLAELDRIEERDGRQKAIEASQLAFDVAKAHNETLKTAEAELRIACERKDLAEKELKAFQNAFEKAKDLHSKLVGARQNRLNIVERRRDINETILTARTALESADNREREIREHLTRLETALKAREAWERLAEKKRRLARAETIRQTLEEDEAKLALIKVTQQAIEKLQALEIERATLRAIDEAASPSIEMVYDGNPNGRVIMNDTPLADGEERRYAEQARLTIAGVGHITLRSNRPLQNDGRLQRVEENYRTLLASLGVTDFGAARTQLIQAQEIKTSLGGLQGQMSQLIPEGLAKLRAEIAADEMDQAEVLELKEDPTQVRVTLVNAEEIRKTASEALREAEPARVNIDDAFVAVERDLASLNVEQGHVEIILGPEEQRGARASTLSDVFNTLDQMFSTADADVKKLRNTSVDLESAEAALKRSRSADEAAVKEISNLRETISGLNAEIRTRADDAVEEKWREVVERLEAASSRLKAFEMEVAILQKLFATLEAARSQARELYLKPVMTELKPLLRLMFDDVAITFDDKTLLPQSIRRNGQDEDIDRLSGGMREQLSVLTRLAFARLLARDGRPAPVILDDALVYSDDDRIEKMFDALHRQATNQQIIVFSCRQRAFQKLGGNILQMTDWYP